MYGKGASGTGEWASWTAGWCRRILPGAGGRGGAGTRWRWAVGWAGDTRESEERRLARSPVVLRCSPVVLRCSSLATAAATPRRTARSRSGRSNMWDAFVWRMYLCWRHAGCINSPRGHSLGAMGGEGGSSESVESALENMSTNPRRPASCFSSFPFLHLAIHRTTPSVHRHACHPPPTLPRTTTPSCRTRLRLVHACASRQPSRHSRPRPSLRSKSQEEAPRRRSESHHCRGRQVQAETYTVPTARAERTSQSRSQRLGEGKRTRHGDL